MEIIKRPRRNRFSPTRRALIKETKFSAGQLIAPLFIKAGVNQKEPLPSLPGVFSFTADAALKECEELLKLGIGSVILFPIIDKNEKDHDGTKALSRSNHLAKAVQLIKKECPEMVIMVDIALDAYTSHGHDGLIDGSGYVLNDSTNDILADMSVLYGELGVDYVAPSDMMDGRVGKIRKHLDEKKLCNVGILAYTAKYSSAFYGPYRNTLDSTPTIGDKRGYQMDPCNVKEALLEASLDEEEGADMLLVKPALAYLDIIYRIQQTTSLPVGGFHVSGEFAMLKAAAEKGWMNYEKALQECITAIFRSGANFCITYGSKDLAKHI